MKKLLVASALLFALISLHSCVVVNTLLGVNDNCDYPNCDRQRADNCNYCSLHCDGYALPENFNHKVDQSIRKQIEPFK